jgi:hypothetical protein
MSKFNVGDVVRLNNTAFQVRLRGLAAVIVGIAMDNLGKAVIYRLWAKDEFESDLLFLDGDFEELKPEDECGFLLAHYYASQICGEIE